MKDIHSKGTFTVLMSVYKSEKGEFLDRAMTSIWTDQTVRPDKIVLIKDGPLGKELQEVIDQWEKNLGEKLLILNQEKNLGLTKSLNNGIKVINTDYIARMDSDDISMSERFERQVEFLDRNPNIMVVGGRLQEFDSENENLGIRKFPLSPKEVRKYIAKASPLAHPTVMMRKEIFDKGLSYNERYRTSQDIALWFDVLAAGFDIANLGDVTLKFRREGDVYRRRSRSKAKNELIIYLKGIRKLYGLFTPLYLYPLSRFIFRMMPVSIVKKVYGSGLRQRFLSGKQTTYNHS